MEDKKKFELNDEALDTVSGGAVTDADYAACPFPHNSIIRNKNGHSCLKCQGDPEAGYYANACTTARVRYSYATPPQIVLTCTRCGQGFMGERGDPIEKSIFFPNEVNLNGWELAAE